MKNKEEVEKMIGEAINSVDGTNRARPMPFLLTRVMARINTVNENAWEKAVRFIARPVVAVAGLALVIGINVAVIATQGANKEANNVTEQQNTADEFFQSVATLYNMENTDQ